MKWLVCLLLLVSGEVFTTEQKNTSKQPEEPSVPAANPSEKQHQRTLFNLDYGDNLAFQTSRFENDYSQNLPSNFYDGAFGLGGGYPDPYSSFGSFGSLDNYGSIYADLNGQPVTQKSGSITQAIPANAQIQRTNSFQQYPPVSQAISTEKKNTVSVISTDETNPSQQRGNQLHLHSQVPSSTEKSFHAQINSNGKTNPAQIGNQFTLYPQFSLPFPVEKPYPIQTDPNSSPDQARPLDQFQFYSHVPPTVPRGTSTLEQSNEAKTSYPRETQSPSLGNTVRTNSFLSKVQEKLPLFKSTSTPAPKPLTGVVYALGQKQSTVQQVDNAKSSTTAESAKKNEGGSPVFDGNADGLKLSGPQLLFSGLNSNEGNIFAGNAGFEGFGNQQFGDSGVFGPSFGSFSGLNVQQFDNIGSLGVQQFSDFSGLSGQSFHDVDIGHQIFHGSSL